MILQAHNLTKIYPNGGGLGGVDFNINRGEFVLLTGSNGAGKSTLIKILSLFEQPDKGHIIMEGMRSDNLKLSHYPAWRRKLGIIPQDLLLLSNRTVFQNLMIGQRAIGLSRRVSKQRVLKILAQVGLSHKLREMTGNLSGGEARRVSIARALCSEPFLLLADEPLGDLDPETAQGIMRLFEKINALGTAILMVTHRNDVLPTVKYRKIEMVEGKLVQNSN